MNVRNVRNQLCKVLDDIGQQMGLQSSCICDEGGWGSGEVPDEIIVELWTRVSAPTQCTSSMPPKPEGK